MIILLSVEVNLHIAFCKSSSSGTNVSSGSGELAILHRQENTANLPNAPPQIAYDVKLKNFLLPFLAQARNCWTGTSAHTEGRGARLPLRAHLYIIMFLHRSRFGLFQKTMFSMLVS